MCHLPSPYYDPYFFAFLSFPMASPDLPVALVISPSTISKALSFHPTLITTSTIAIKSVYDGGGKMKIVVVKLVLALAVFLGWWCGRIQLEEDET